MPDFRSLQKDVGIKLKTKHVQLGALLGTARMLRLVLSCSLLVVNEKVM